MNTKPELLIVEDDENIRQGLVIELRNTQRYVVHQAPDAPEALEMIKHNPPTLALVDIMMPSGDKAGLDLIDELQHQKLLGKMAVIILSAKNNSADILDALSRGAIDYLVKPYEPEELIARVQRAVEWAAPSKVVNETEDESSNTCLRQKIVETMNLTLSYWQLTTGKNKVSFADESGLWSTYVDKKGTCSTKTLDKYLQVSTLPKNPKMTHVIRSVQFSLSHCPRDNKLTEKLERLLLSLQ